MFAISSTQQHVKQIGFNPSLVRLLTKTSHFTSIFTVISCQLSNSHCSHICCVAILPLNDSLLATTGRMISPFQCYS